MRKKSKRYILTGGGSGGHVYPALAIADYLRSADENSRFLYVGMKGKIEEEIVPARGFHIEFVKSSPFPGLKPSPSFFSFLFNLLRGSLSAARIIRSFKPDVIIAVGGYVSAPVTISLAILRRLGLTRARLFLHEQNSVPGKLNRLSGRWADFIGVSFPESARYFQHGKVSVVGYPVRTEIGSVKLNAEEIREALGIPEKAKVLFAFGASQGARTINRAIIGALPELLSVENLVVIHATGKKKKGTQTYDPVADTDRCLESAAKSMSQQSLQRYIRKDYFHNIEEIFAICDLVVTRGGAGSLAELEKCGIPVIIIPKSDVPDDHQAVNALLKQEQGSAVALFEEPSIDENGEKIWAVNPHILSELVREILFTPKKLERMAAKSRLFYKGDSLGRISEVIRCLTDGEKPLSKARNKDGTEGNSSSKKQLREKNGGGMDIAEAGPLQLPDLVRRRIGNGSPENAFTFGELQFLHYKTKKFLDSSIWQTRNVGVKLAGILKFEDTVDILSEILKDRRKAPFLHRLFGGDYIQVGFIRRNAVASLASIGIVKPGMIEMITELMLEDPYYEVRAKACEAVAILYNGSHQETLEEHFRKLLWSEKKLEVKAAAILALGSISSKPDMVDFLKKYLADSDWLMREAALHAITSMVDRGIVRDPLIDGENILLTCPQFYPVFPLRVAFLELFRRKTAKDES